MDPAEALHANGKKQGLALYSSHKPLGHASHTYTTTSTTTDNLKTVNLIITQNHHGSYARSRKGHLYVSTHPKFDLSVSSKVNSPASSALPYRRSPPSWLKTTSSDVVEHIIKLARKGLTPSQIGVALRDSHGIPQVRFVTGNKILRILKSNGASVTFS